MAALWLRQCFLQVLPLGEALALLCLSAARGPEWAAWAAVAALPAEAPPARPADAGAGAVAVGGVDIAGFSLADALADVGAAAQRHAGLARHFLG